MDPINETAVAMNDVVVRHLQRQDRAAWDKLWSGYLEFYGVRLSAAITDATFEKLLDDPRFTAFVACSGDVILGFCHCSFHPSTWANTDYCYLEDLYVDRAVRGGGAGRLLIEAVYELADQRKAARVYWATQSGNAAARRLYDKVATLTDFVQYRR